MTWPLIQRNKVDDSKIDVPVTILSNSENQAVANLAKKVDPHDNTVIYLH
jgi:[histone H3]-lysine36 N-trimethyltransferase